MIQIDLMLNCQDDWIFWQYFFHKNENAYQIFDIHKPIASKMTQKRNKRSIMGSLNFNDVW